MRVVFVFAYLLLASGCSSLLDIDTTPEPAKVAAYTKEIGIAANEMKTLGYVKPTDYLLASIAYSNAACDQFFDHLARLRDDSKLIDRVISSAIGSGGSLMAAFEAGKVATRTTAIVLASLTAANDVNKLIGEIYFFSKYAGALRYQVRKQMSAHVQSIEWQNLVRQIDGSSDTSAQGWILARMAGEGYAHICSITNLHQIVETAVATDAQPGAANFPKPASPPGRGSPLAGALPNYRIGH